MLIAINGLISNNLYMSQYSRISGELGSVPSNIISGIPTHTVTAEQRLKTAKRLTTDNVGPYGELDTNKFKHTILQYRNAHDQDTKLSPAIIYFKHPTSDVQMAKL